ncbi:MAG TPA: sporulation protein [Bacillus bacterium]|nr:sporulation protein [Bacillus sp. (in: firmicutes)]
MDNWLDLFLLVFASFRLTRLIVYDTITEFIRAPFHETVVETLADGRKDTYIEIKGSGIKYWIGELLSCHWCTGFWCSVIIYGAYEFYPHISLPFISIFAIAGIASIIQSWVVKSTEN